ncbi:glycosyltransferase family 2 protein [Endothiovibrio diazotrophicus]
MKPASVPAGDGRPGLFTRFWRVCGHEGWAGVIWRLRRRVVRRADYARWVARYEESSLSSKDRRGAEAPPGPLISVVMPVYNAPERWLRAAIESVLGQRYSRWELCIADDASSASHIKPLLDEYAARDPRVKVVFRSVNGHISEASNSALALASGDFVALLDQDDLLSSDALRQVAAAIRLHPDAGILFSDEDKVDQHGRRYDPYFKPDWNLDLFLGQNMISHLGVYRTELIRKIGGFRKGFEGSQDWDLALRATDSLEPGQIVHIPAVLYHWRAIEGSTASSIEEKPYAVEAAVRAVKDRLARSGQQAEVSAAGPFGAGLRVRYPLPREAPLATVVVIDGGSRGALEKTLLGIAEHAGYPALEVVVVTADKGGADGVSLSCPLRTLVVDAGISPAERRDRGAMLAQGEVVLFVEAGLVPVDDEWLNELVSQALRPEVGAVGAKLGFDDGVLCHAGLVIGGDALVLWPHRGIAVQDPGYFGRSLLVQEFSAISGMCMALRKTVLEAVGGFCADERVRDFYDVNLCLSIREQGWRVVWTPFARLDQRPLSWFSRPGRSVGNPAEVEYMEHKWGRKGGDPFYSPNLSLENGLFHLAFPPRAVLPR